MALTSHDKKGLSNMTKKYPGRISDIKDTAGHISGIRKLMAGEQKRKAIQAMLKKTKGYGEK